MSCSAVNSEIPLGGLQSLDLVFRSGEVITYVFYDVDNDKLRNRIASVCKNYGLVRIQYSGFVGYLSKNRRQELGLKMRDLLKNCEGRVLIQPVCEKDFRQHLEYIQIGKGTNVSD